MCIRDSVAGPRGEDNVARKRGRGDFGLQQGPGWIRARIKQREALYVPRLDDFGPDPDQLSSARLVEYTHSGESQGRAVEDDWRRKPLHRMLPNPWTG
eukprot:15446972-Alexandrium_andersonii.AAC.1